MHFDGLMQKLIDDMRPLAGNQPLVATHIDSWETGTQNWTPEFRSGFRRLRGYDPLPLLPVMAGRIVDNLEVSERFLWDVRMTVSDLLESIGFGGKPVVVELNEQAVFPRDYPSVRVEDGARIEIVTLAAGG